MGLKAIERNPVTETVAANKKFFAFFCLTGILLVGSGLFSLRIEKTIRAAGEVRAEDEFYVFSPAEGTIARHHVRIGQRVEEGAPLFSLAGEDLELRILDKRRQLAEIGNELAAVDLAVKRAEIKPGEKELLTARARLKALDQIQQIHHDIVASWERLEGERAIRGLDYNLQRIASLRTRLEALDSQLLADWEEAGLLALELEGLVQRRRGLDEVRKVLAEEISVLERKRRSLDVTSPISGTVIDIYQRYPGLALKDGETVMKIADVENGYRVRAFVGQRNIDLLRQGTPVRMESQVFDSLFEGYVMGRIERIVAEATRREGSDPEDPRYEVTIVVEESPYPLVLGSRMDVEFLLGRQPLLALLMNRHEARVPVGASGQEERRAVETDVSGSEN